MSLGEDWLWFLLQPPRTHHVTIQRLLPLVNDDSGAGTTHLHPVCGAFTKNTTQEETRLITEGFGTTTRKLLHE